MTACDREAGNNSPQVETKPRRAAQEAGLGTSVKSRNESITDWERLLAAAEKNSPDEATRERARFKALQDLLAGVEADQFADAADFVRKHYQTSYQSALLEYLTESLAGRSSSLGDLLTVIQSWPPGSGRWVSIRVLASRLPRAALDELMRSITPSSLPEEQAAVLDGLRNRLFNAQVEEFTALNALSGQWGDSAKALLRGMEPKYAAQGSITLSEGVARFGDDPARLTDFLGNYTLRHPGEISKWLLSGEVPAELLTDQNLLVAVHDGINAPEVTGDALDRIKLADESTKALAAETLVSRWLHHDPDAASRWLRGTSSEGVRQGGGRAILGYLQRTGDTESYQEWNRWLNTTGPEAGRSGQ